jgi:tripartite ATP-independent transporter DctP family solute receptor
MKQKIVLIAAAVLILAMIPGTVFAGGTRDAKAGEKIVFKLSHVFTPLQPLHIALLDVAKKVNERTGGQIEIQVYPDGEIPNGVDGVEQCIRGAYFINVYDPSCMQNYVPDYAALIGPMLYENPAEYSAMVKTDFAKSLNKKAEEKGLKVLALDYNFGMRNVIMAKKQVQSADDLLGLKIRVPKTQLWIDTFQSFGANPVGLGWAEVYNSMQSGVVDALETTISDTWDNQIQEVAKYTTKTAHFVGTGAVMLSKAVWDKLTTEQQKIMEEEFLAGAKYNNELSDKDEASAQQKLEAQGMVFNTIDLTSLRVKSRAAFDKMSGLTPGVYDTITAELAKIRAK